MSLLSSLEAYCLLDLLGFVHGSVAQADRLTGQIEPTSEAIRMSTESLIRCSRNGNTRFLMLLLLISLLFGTIFAQATPTATCTMNYLFDSTSPAETLQQLATKFSDQFDMNPTSVEFGFHRLSDSKAKYTDQIKIYISGTFYDKWDSTQVTDKLTFINVELSYQDASVYHGNTAAPMQAKVTTVITADPSLITNIYCVNRYLVDKLSPNVTPAQEVTINCAQKSSLPSGGCNITP